MQREQFEEEKLNQRGLNSSVDLQRKRTYSQKTFQDENPSQIKEILKGYEETQLRQNVQNLQNLEETYSEDVNEDSARNLNRKSDEIPHKRIRFDNIAEVNSKSFNLLSPAFQGVPFGNICNHDFQNAQFGINQFMPTNSLPQFELPNQTQNAGNGCVLNNTSNFMLTDTKTLLLNEIKRDEFHESKDLPAETLDFLAELQGWINLVRNLKNINELEGDLLKEFQLIAQMMLKRVNGEHKRLKEGHKFIYKCNQRVIYGYKDNNAFLLNEVEQCTYKINYDHTVKYINQGFLDIYTYLKEDYSDSRVISRIILAAFAKVAASHMPSQKCRQFMKQVEDQAYDYIDSNKRVFNKVHKFFVNYLKTFTNQKSRKIQDRKRSVSEFQIQRLSQIQQSPTQSLNRNQLYQDFINSKEVEMRDVSMKPVSVVCCEKEREIFLLKEKNHELQSQGQELQSQGQELQSQNQELKTQIKLLESEIDKLKSNETKNQKIQEVYEALVQELQKNAQQQLPKNLKSELRSLKRQIKSENYEKIQIDIE
ncbi:hypothetical protein OXYTRIMIC_159 [Oxytricha trifallax]|uniref:Uncharacterized protein n=1 Tax=Oxytricha trifallax TaxID=1172189 RepID=A0A073IC02_9SPIT|nr:hypothetical protein OXYTRIMIC_159 [Oxytricha trifallax]